MDFGTAACTERLVGLFLPVVYVCVCVCGQEKKNLNRSVEIEPRRPDGFKEWIWSWRANAVLLKGRRTLKKDCVGLWLSQSPGVRGAAPAPRGLGLVVRVRC